MKEEQWDNMRYKGIPLYSRPECPPDTLYLINTDLFDVVYPMRKNGFPDMRYSGNKLKSLLDPTFRYKRIMTRTAITSYSVVKK